MSTRLDYLVRKLGDLDDAIAREKTEYDKARDRYDKMRSRDILNELFDQLKGYRTEHDQLRRSNSAQATLLTSSNCTQHAPRKLLSINSITRHRGMELPRKTLSETNNKRRLRPSTGQPSPIDRTPSVNAPIHEETIMAPTTRQLDGPVASQLTIVDYEIEEPDGKSYIVRGGAVVRDFDPARDKVRKAE
ncbi:hypothetical protein J7T55_003775 [Diaporthe amygdali]|uniref:uncharacterized protein n=1 Tax=Phomopsis amygdali TaxID=1214568 RepID=UPI0022FE8D73|nr:uncharacterized protein J7T55_003775 [Diaporthe amygdali]KAJ0117361.1 hypothetical protein J7T55_003775 [Diaporthe amygdali]